MLAGRWRGGKECATRGARGHTRLGLLAMARADSAFEKKWKTAALDGPADWIAIRFDWDRQRTVFAVLSAIKRDETCYLQRRFEVWIRNLIQHRSYLLSKLYLGNHNKNSFCGRDHTIRLLVITSLLFVQFPRWVSVIRIAQLIQFWIAIWLTHSSTTIVFERPENCSDIVFVLAFVNLSRWLVEAKKSFDLQLLLTFAIEITWFGSCVWLRIK